jgi:ATPase subunit of ABC transporter with duplicated ATPase domains
LRAQIQERKASLCLSFFIWEEIMSILNLENITFGYEDKTILKNISFRLLKGEHAGLIGANGAGKTTLFNLLCGTLIPDSGTLSMPSAVKIGYLDQQSLLEEASSIRESLRTAFSSLYQLEKEMLSIADRLSIAAMEQTGRLLRDFGRLQERLQQSDFYSIDSHINNVAGGLGLSALGMDTPIRLLSGGQRTKIKLAKLLLEHPNLLLLDEPTNYLDKEHVDWLADYLCSYPGSFIVISHDTVLLNRITNVIYHLEYAGIKRYPGNYDKFVLLQEEEHKKYMLEYARQQQQIAKLEDFISKNLVRASTTKQAQSRRKQLNKIERLETPKKLPKPAFRFSYSRESSLLVFQSRNLSIGYSHPLISSLNFKLTRGEKIAITGCNGIGKTTLLKTIMGVLPGLGGHMEHGEFLSPLYFEQEVTQKDWTPLEAVWADFPGKTQKEIREALAKCGLKQEHVLQRMSALSGGEQSKVRLCKLLLQPGNWLLLDEPTNHLDLHAKQALKEALAAFEGTVLLVCHEEAFYRDWVTGIWDMEAFIGG